MNYDEELHPLAFASESPAAGVVEDADSTESDGHFVGASRDFEECSMVLFRWFSLFVSVLPCEMQGSVSLSFTVV